MYFQNLKLIYQYLQVNYTNLRPVRNEADADAKQQSLFGIDETLA